VIGVSCTGLCATDPLEARREVARSFSHWEIFSEGAHAVHEVVGPFTDECLDMTYSLHSSISDTNIAAVNDRMRAASLAEFSAEMDACCELGIDTITVHPGIHNLVCDGLRQRSLICSGRSLRELDRMSAEIGVRVAVENMPNPSFMLGRTADELHQLVDGTDLGVCFDIGHANTTGQIDRMLDLLSDRIINVHIHDNMGDMDAHLTLGEGNIDFRHVISRLAGYRGRYIIESRTLDSARVSQGILAGMLGQS
jgi:sugar phosphate isomerase/epimerase